MRVVKTVLLLVLAVPLAVLLIAISLSENLWEGASILGATLAALSFWSAAIVIILAAAALVHKIWEEG